MLIQVDKLPSNFKPYKFKSFSMKAMTLQQAIDLGKNPKLKDIVNLFRTLVDDKIDVSQLVPIDVKFLLSGLSFHAYPKQTWTIDVTCPHCRKSHKRTIKMEDFPPVPSLSDDDPYPLTIDDGVHVWELGYATVDATDELIEKLKLSGVDKEAVAQEIAELDPVTAIDLVLPYILSVDGSKEGIKDKILGLEDFGVLYMMLEVIKTYFTDDTYAEFTCPECEKTYRVPMSAVEVAQFTPFPNKGETSQYKTNFRL